MYLLFQDLENACVFRYEEIAGEMCWEQEEKSQMSRFDSPWH